MLRESGKKSLASAWRRRNKPPCMANLSELCLLGIVKNELRRSKTEMKRAVRGDELTLDEDLPPFSLDSRDMEELESLLGKWGFTTQINDAMVGDESITASFAEVTLKLSSKVNSIRMPTIHFKRKIKTFVIDMGWIQTPSMGDRLLGESHISVAISLDREKEALDIINAVYGFILRKNKELKMDEEPGILYFRPKESVEYRKRIPKPQADEARIIRNTVESKLRKVIREGPENEQEIQDAIENILIIKDYEYHKEIIRVPSGTKSTIPDFTLDNIGLAVEVKLCKDAIDERRILEEINADISTYKSRYPKILFVVYDLGVIRDMDRFGRDILSHDGVYLAVIKH